MRPHGIPLHPLLGLLLSVAVFSSEALSQRVWIVDAQQRPGFDFSDLPPALTAAAPGDVIRVLSAPTAYATATLQKGVTIVGGRYNFATTSWLIRNIPSGQTLTLIDVVSSASDQPLRLEFRNNQGRIVLDRCRSLDSSPLVPIASSAMIVDQCASVFMRACSTWGSPALAISRSNVVAVDCRWNGVDPSATVGIHVADSSLILAQNTVQAILRPAVESLRTNLTVTGDGPAYLQGGGTTTASPAIQTTSGTVLLDPSLALNPFLQGPSVGGSATVNVRNVPFALGSAVQRGGQMQFELAGAPGLQATLLLALPSPRLPSPFGDLYLDPTTLIPLVSAVIPGTRRITFRAPVPATVGFGVTLHLQGLVVESGALVLSEPCAVTTS